MTRRMAKNRPKVGCPGESVETRDVRREPT